MDITEKKRMKELRKELGILEGEDEPESKEPEFATQSFYTKIGT